MANGFLARSIDLTSSYVDGGPRPSSFDLPGIPVGRPERVQVRPRRPAPPDPSLRGPESVRLLPLPLPQLAGFASFPSPLSLWAAAAAAPLAPARARGKGEIEQRRRSVDRGGRAGRATRAGGGREAGIARSLALSGAEGPRVCLLLRVRLFLF